MHAHPHMHAHTHAHKHALAHALARWRRYEHNVLSAVSIIAIIVYAIGLPVFTLGVCVWAQRRDLLRNRDMLLVLGILYREYGE